MQSAKLKALGVVGAGLVAAVGVAFAARAGGAANGAPVVQLAVHAGPDLAMPAMNPERGKMLFASKGCVVCHSINGVGGTDAPRLDASTMAPHMNPFDFFARMWRGAQPMIAMQQNELGHQIEFTGQDLADIVAFAHDAAVQKTFSEKDIPANINALMNEDEDNEATPDKREESTPAPGRGMGSYPGMGPGMGSSQGMGPGMMGGRRMRP